MTNQVTPMPRIATNEKNRFCFRGDFKILNSKKLFTRRKVKFKKSAVDTHLYRQVEIMISVSKFFCLWPLKKNFSCCVPSLLVSIVAISVWTYYSLGYARNNIRLIFAATARFILTFVRLIFCCLSVISTLYLNVAYRSDFYSFFKGMAKVDSVLKTIRCPVRYPNNSSFLFHTLFTFSLITVQTDFFSRQNFLLEVQNQYRYCVFITIHLFCVLLGGLSHRFQLISSAMKKCNVNRRYKMYTLITTHKNLCYQIKKLRNIYSFQIVMILAAIVITYIWNIHRFTSKIFRFEDELAKSKVVNFKSRTIMITLYTYWLWLIANAGEKLKKKANNFYEELYTVIINDETNTLSKDLVLKAYLRVRPKADYRLCKIIALNNRIIQYIMGITVSYIIVSIQLSVPCKCRNGIIPNHFS